MKILDFNILKNNKGIVANVVAAFGFKGFGMIVNMLSMPLSGKEVYVGVRLSFLGCAYMQVPVEQIRKK